MEFDKTKWSCPCNSDQNCTQKYPRRLLGGQDGLGSKIRTKGISVGAYWGGG